ncbi:MAG: hypothetical protein ABFQ65_03535 [Nanoarchaeota archaeon]
MEDLEKIADKLLAGEINSSQAENILAQKRINSLPEIKSEKKIDNFDRVEIKFGGGYSFINYHFEEDVCWIDWAESEPSRQGLYLQVFDKLQELAINQCAKSLKSRISYDNLRMYKISKNAGFVEESMDYFVYPPEYVMRKDLVFD